MSGSELYARCPFEWLANGVMVRCRLAEGHADSHEAGAPGREDRLRWFRQQWNVPPDHVCDGKCMCFARSCPCEVCTPITKRVDERIRVELTRPLREWEYINGTWSWQNPELWPVAREGEST